MVLRSLWHAPPFPQKNDCRRDKYVPCLATVIAQELAQYANLLGCLPLAALLF
jgi:hypothetical protein